MTGGGTGGPQSPLWPITVLLWIGGILAGATIAGFAMVTAQLIRLTGEVSALAEIVRSMSIGG